MNISSYEATIKSLNPLIESGFNYNIEKWKKLNPNFSIHALEFENKFVARKDVIDAFENYFTGLTTWEKPFVLTMIWGFADTGYGTHRTNNYLASESNHELIIAGFNAVKNGNLKLAYKYFQKIKGLNISYISKILYFATRAVKQKEYALIYDIRVANSLVKLTTTPEIFEIIKVTPSSKFSHYEKYNNLLHSYSAKHNIEADCLEMFLFNQKF